jgi:hypothetical protein
MENRHGFCVSFELTPSVGVTESQRDREKSGAGLSECRGGRQAAQASVLR